MTKTDWTETEVQLALFGWLERRQRTTIVLNITPKMGWHECDVFSLTRTGYFHEIEVKVSRSDYWADFKKFRKHRTLIGDGFYAERYRRDMPRSFCYACPEELLMPDDIPSYAGLLWIHRYEPRWGDHWLDYDVQIIKKPPVLSGSQKMTPSELAGIAVGIWYRYGRIWKQMARYEAKADYLSATPLVSLLNKKKDRRQSHGLQ